MITQMKKRFWSDATVAPVGDGFEIRLDARSLKTPAKSALVVPTAALAQAVADEWQAQGGTVKPATMPMTRRANAAIDKVAPQTAAVAAMLAEYGGSDLLCYRADSPRELIERQAAAWDPILDWTTQQFDAPLIVTSGVIHAAQNPQSLARLAAPIHALTPFSLTGFHDLVTLSGSLVVALAAIDGGFAVDDLWQASRLDEIWQAELWGQDDEAEATAAAKRQDFLDAHAFYQLAV